MPSRTDSFGIVYLEAWLYRKPVIGARAWGVTDLIEHERDGLLVPFGDVPALVNAITSLLDHPAKAAIMGNRGETKVLTYHTWMQKARQIDTLYRRLVGQGHEHSVGSQNVDSTMRDQRWNRAGRHP
jgi:glycosyltransferase involved in cell wall biosynthesis